MPPHARQTPAQRKNYPKALANLKDITAPHIQAFDYAVGEGFAGMVLQQQEFEVKAVNSPAPGRGHTLRIWFEQVSLGQPLVEGKALFPRECRERGLDYSAEMQADFVYQLDEKPPVSQRVSLGQAPVMVLSKKCRLHALSPEKMVTKGEDAAELGGYFIASGNERLLRYFQLPKRNIPQAIVRGSNRKFGEGFTDYAVAMRCVRAADQQSSTLTIHYSRDGTVYCRIRYRKIEYFIPLGLMLKALAPANEVTDQELFQRISRGDEFIASRIELELRKASDRGWKKTKDALEFMGNQFKDRLADACAPNATAEEMGRTFIDLLIFIHLDDAHGKLECLVEMARKLYAAVQESCGADDPDAFDSHELLLGGHLYLQSAKEMLEDSLGVVRKDIEVTMAKKGFELAPFLTQLSSRLLVLAQRYGNVGRKLFSILATGSIAFSKTGLDMAQVGGFSIIADKLNRLRYLAHFHSVHRGTFFAEMKTTMGRKLLPQAWGFLCPVHTPDGAPCGLLNHMAQLAGIVALPQLSPSASELHVKDLCLLLASWGMLPSRSVGGSGVVPPRDYFPILFDGRVLGHASEEACQYIASQLHFWKAKLLKSILERNFADWVQEKSFAYFPTARVIARVSLERDLCSKSTEREQRAICPTMEVAMISKTSTSNTSTYPYPGLFLSTGQARMIRPVIQLKTGWVELIGPLEQVFLKIACARDEIDSTRDTYVELDVASSMLSVIASMTPFSDFNQSPRNMYQCQMGKQTMGTPCHSFPQRADNKMYRLQNVQYPLVKTQAQDTYMIDEYPNGCNAVVCVISYTGYDMDDAMIINKSSMERGFGHASVYTTVDLEVEASAEEWISNRDGTYSSLDTDGLPQIGTRLKEGDYLCSIWNNVSQRYRVEKFKDSEPAVVLRVKMMEPNTSARSGKSFKKSKDNESGGVRKASITLRYDRNPTIGDKFSSRHGQKGVLSVLWPQQDMPFSESGMTPDVIINPHAFPSRMTIGMLVESLAGKAGALHGKSSMDATPFTMQGDNPGKMANDYFGQQLLDAGYSYYGSEPMYSGVFGAEMHCDIFIGVVYYQRLRHMVLDKSQVRATGPVDVITRQPIKGRKRHGGVRFGEMERDSLIAHGTAFLCEDRLLNCSDRHTAHVCCGSLLSSYTLCSTSGSEALSMDKSKVHCRLCGRSDQWKLITVPYAFRYLTNELAGMGIRLEFKTAEA